MPTMIARGLQSLKWRSVSHRPSRLDICFMGSGTFPTAHRAPPCTILSFDKESWVIDAGEGSVRQMAQSAVRFAAIARVFISRLEPSHVFGLPILLLSELGKKRTTPLNIYGPEGIAKFLYNALLPFEVPQVRSIVINELVTSSDSIETPSSNHTDSYIPQDNMQFISQGSMAVSFGVRKIAPDASGFWRLVDNNEVTVLANTVSSPQTTFGFVVKEVNKQGSLRLDACASLGVPVEYYRTLKEGGDITLPGTSTVIRSKDVLNPPVPGRKLTFISSGCDASRLLPAAHGSDVVVHDSCFLQDKLVTAKKLGHATPTIAAQFAQRAQANNLILTRIGNYLGPIGHGEALIKSEVQDIYPHALCARDFTQFHIPRGGFSWNKGNTQSNWGTLSYIGPVWRAKNSNTNGQQTP